VAAFVGPSDIQFGRFHAYNLVPFGRSG